MAHTVEDDGFHEIQLNGKQLVFLFMAATVVSVVIFLCGVLVGRGVRAERGGAPEAAVASDAPAEITPSQPPQPAAPLPASADPTAVTAPPPQAEDASYFKRLDESKPQDDPKPAPKAASTPAPAQPAAQPAHPPAAPQAASAPAPKSAPAPRATKASTAASAQPSKDAAPADTASAPAPGAGYAVQIAALNVRSEADAIAKHLASKGYQAYVSSNGTPAIYRVRIGTFKTRREAETIAARLQKEEQLKPWVTR